MIEDKLTLFHIFGFIPVSIISVFDILIVAFIFYRVLGLIRGTPAAQIVAGLFLVVTVAMVAPLLKMEALMWLMEQVLSILLILLVILFQPELRRVLGVLGQGRLFRWFYKIEETRVFDEVASSAEQLARLGYGALIVLTREVGLRTIVDSGVAAQRAGLGGPPHDHLHVSFTTPRPGRRHRWGNPCRGAMYAAPGRGGGREAPGDAAPGCAGPLPGIRCGDGCGFGGKQSHIPCLRRGVDRGVEPCRIEAAPGRADGLGQEERGGGRRGRKGLRSPIKPTPKKILTAVSPRGIFQ